MKDFLKSHVHPLGGRIIFWNLILLIVIKLVLPQSAFRLASLIDTIPTFDSREIIKFTNDVRITNGLSPLSANTQLDSAASDKLKDMALQEYFAHVSPTGVSPWYWVKKSGYQYSVAGENLALGFYTANDTVRAWMDSPSHRENLLNTQYKEIGVAVGAVEINDQNGILVVQMFGLPQTQKTLARPITTIQPSITVSPSPVLSVSPTATPVQIALTRGETAVQDAPIVAQHVINEPESTPDMSPVQVNIASTEEVKEFAGNLNNAFSAYFLLFAAITGVAFMYHERTKSMAFKLALNVSLFILSIVIPLVEFTSKGLII